jgi:hypothetical protein
VDAFKNLYYFLQNSKMMKLIVLALAVFATVQAEVIKIVSVCPQSELMNRLISVRQANLPRRFACSG